ncbi:MAG: heavy metal translocating P-type ATPase [Boseongicola sp. SB0675_bin_26]|nr:heavy metal translocating P-type ATPase [Boseongicola sp. SB0675_bin_26]
MTCASPTCAHSDAATDFFAASDTVPTHTLVLPSVHCAGCIRTVETVLSRQPGIRSARVNLTRRRAAVLAVPGADPGPWIRALAAAGIEAHEATRDAGGIDNGTALVLPLGVAGFAMMNVMLLSVAVWSGASDSTRDLLHWISAAIALPATVYAAQPFFRHAWSALRVGRLNIDVPISLAIILASAMSLYEVANGGEHAWFDAALALTFFLLAGRALDQRMRRSARSAAADLAIIEPARAIRIEHGEKRSRPLGEFRVGDTLWLAAGTRVPVDAVLDDGGAEVDRSAITGESDSLTLTGGDTLTAGDIVLTGPVTATATAVGEDTTLRRMTRLVATAENARSRYSGLADRAAAIYTPTVHILAAAAFLGWLLAAGDVRMALNVAIATLIITCPCALGLAVPAVAVAATSRLYRNGLLVKSETALERLAGIDTVVFDKTGTLTRRALKAPSGMPDADRRILRTLADCSDHPLSRTLLDALAATPAADVSNVREIAGRGVEGTWNGATVRFGRGDWVGGSSDTAFAVGGRAYDVSGAEELLPNARKSIDLLKAKGLEVCLLTGDTGARARQVAARLGVDRFWSEVSPEGKSSIIQDLRADGCSVLMVGDGLNDTAALAAADASIAPGSALDASRNAADLVIVSGRLSGVAEAIGTARLAKRRILQNFGVAAVYNAIAVPLAMAGIATPLMAAIAMSTSSLVVILNAGRGRRR